MWASKSRYLREFIIWITKWPRLNSRFKLDNIGLLFTVSLSVISITLDDLSSLRIFNSDWNDKARTYDASLFDYIGIQIEKLFNKALIWSFYSSCTTFSSLCVFFFIFWEYHLFDSLYLFVYFCSVSSFLF